MVTRAEKLRVGALIRDRRQELGLNQPEFARRVGVSRNTVSSWEQGHSYPSRHLGKIKAVLHPFNLNGAPVTFADPAEQALWDTLDFLSEAERWDLIEKRRRRNRPPG